MNHRLLFTFVLLAFALTSQAASHKRHDSPPPTRIACVGNSVTYGYGLADREHDAYPVRLQSMLDAKYGAGKFYVGNFGHSGATLLSKGHRPYIHEPEFRQALDFKPDWVVIHLGLNDTDPRNWPDWKEEFIPDYRALIDSFMVVNPDARILICKMTPIFDRHPRFQSGTRDWHAQIQQAIEQVAFGAHVQLIDLYTPLHSRPDLFPDALHPNPEGAKILAQTVFAALTGDYGGLQLPPLYSNGMVLPRDEHLLIEGQANARQSIHGVLSKGRKVVKECSAFTRADGSWSIELDHMQAGGPYTLTLTSTPLRPGDYQLYYPSHYPFDLLGLKPKDKNAAKAEKLVIDSIFFGDVWLASGQSNMELRVDQCNTLEQDIADARRLSHRIHLYNMPARARTDAVAWPDSVLRFTNQLRHMDFQGWTEATPEAVAAFSAVAFNFARVLADSLPHIPIGIICNAVGGSTTESWIDRETLERHIPNILASWRIGDYGQPWARGRMSQNIAMALNKESTAYNPLQRHPYEPAYLFEAAIAPLQHYPIKGVIWYQGESNTHNTELHDRLFTLLQQSWRRFFARRWQCEFQSKPQLPFYVAQLSSLPRPSWPAFRNSQRLLANKLPYTWMAVTADLGDPSDVHYRTKRPVGQRLALQALRHTYGHNLVSEGPVVVRASAANPGTPDAYVTLHLSNAHGLYASQGFELAGPDGIFHTAQVHVIGTTLRLSSPHVAWPVAVRYAWSPVTHADLHNDAGLPASTFLIEVEN